MPEPTSVYSTDKFIYNYISNPIAELICFIDPNFITFITLLLTIPITYGLLNNWSTLSITTLMLIRQILDCLDGSVARKCNKQSEFGAKFDYITDNIFLTIIIGSMIYLLYNKNDQNKYTGLIIISVLSMMLIYSENTPDVNIITHIPREHYVLSGVLFVGGISEYIKSIS